MKRYLESQLKAIVVLMFLIPAQHAGFQVIDYINTNFHLIKPVNTIGFLKKTTSIKADCIGSLQLPKA